jgi:hypothetical protein
MVSAYYKLRGYFMKYEVLKVEGCHVQLLNVSDHSVGWQTITYLELKIRDIVENIQGFFYKV